MLRSLKVRVSYWMALDRVFSEDSIEEEQFYGMFYEDKEIFKLYNVIQMLTHNIK